jgi:hypothetical protein
MPAARITTCHTPSSCASRSASPQNRVRMMICCEACFGGHSFGVQDHQTNRNLAS